MITENRQPSAYLAGVNDFEFMQHRMPIFEGIARGEQALRDGQTLSNDEAKAKMQEWLK
ncbi:MAG: PHD/YefM family antitoxin component YafN of YafNO toxin-antitoxin module [Phenylobacterium sp.]|jgi:PHD/YefM family antitoxin component YafN of YafNO toxin-antitoxin module